MTLPAPPPEKGTRIVFVGSTRDELLAVDVEENAPAVELSGRISQLTRDDGLPVWVNLANVLHGEHQSAERMNVMPAAVGGGWGRLGESRAKRLAKRGAAT
jgi:hypothetical protein